jgi:putative redox protein
MPMEYVVHAEHQGGMKANATSGDLSIQMDYPMGSGSFTPLELVLVALAGCSLNSLAVLLLKAKQPVQHLSVTVKGSRREEHPTLFTQMDLDFLIQGEGVESAAVERALKLSEEKICPVWAMLKPGVPIRASYRLEKKA